MKKIFGTIFIFFLLLGTLPPIKSFAFDYSQVVNATYIIDQNYNAQLVYNVNLTNNTDDKYVNKFFLNLPFEFSSAMGKYGNELLDTTVVKQNNTKQVVVNLKQIVGKGKVNQFTIVVDHVDIAKKQGNLVNFFIPGVNKSQEIAGYNITIQYSKSLPSLNYISSTPLTTQTNSESTTLTFDQNVLQTSGLLMTYGDRQDYSFEFNYKIDSYTKNYVDQNSLIKLALPFDDASQDIYYTDISPPPTNSYKDEDGNYIAVFNYNQLKGKYNQINFKGNAYVKTKSGLLTTNGSAELTDSQKNYYTLNQQYWDTQAVEINSIVTNQTKDLTTTKAKAKALFDFTVKTLHYSKDELTKKNRLRFGGLGALQNPNNAICQEYADLFVTLARAAHIPSRVIVGLAQPPEEAVNPQTSLTVLHAWNQFYDDQSKNWINVDPTWQSTSNGEIYFDNIGSNHFEMYINGLNSKFPIIPLSFTPSDNVSNTLKITSDDKFVYQTGKNVEVKLNKTIIDTTIDNKATLSITNKTLQVAQINSLTIDGGAVDKSNFPTNLIIFPNSQQNTNLLFSNTNAFGQDSINLNVKTRLITSVDNQIESSMIFPLTIKGSPLILYAIIIGMTIILLILVFTGVALIKRYKYNKLITNLPN